MSEKPTAKPNTLISFHVVQQIRFPWRPSISRQLAEYKLMEGETFEVGEQMLIVRHGTRKLGIPWTNVKNVEFA